MKFENLLIISNTFPDKKNTFIGGVFVKEQLNYIRKYFKEVTVISPVPRSLGLKEDDKYCKNYSYENVKVLFPRFSHLPVAYFRNRLGDNYFKAINKLIKKKNIKFDLIHAHFTWPSGYAGAKLKEKYKKPLVVTVHENREWLLEEYISKNQKIYYSWKSPDALIRVNKIDVSILKEFNKNVFSVPNGFDDSKFRYLDKTICRKKLNLPQDKKILLTVSALIERKGHIYSIEAMKEVIKKRRDVLYILGGSGPLKEKLQKRINDLNLQKYVKLIGFIPDENLPLWMNSCNIFIFPSLSEGNPTVMFESLGCGIPFIGTKVGGIPEIINDNVGILAEPKNPKDLAENILIALDKKWNHKFILDYSKQFTWSNITKKIIEIYEKINIKS